MDIVIAGGGYAGIACATRLARLARENATPVRIRLINPEPVLVERIRLHQAATGQRLRERRIDKLLERAGVELLRGRVSRIDTAARSVQVDGQVLGWDRLVLALGSHSGSREVPGVAEHAIELEPHTAHRLHARLDALEAGAQVVVVGGGLTGIEAATEIAESYPRLAVHLVCRGALAHDFSEPARAYLHDIFERLQVRVHEDVDVLAVSADRLRTDGDAMPFDACVWSAGFRMPALPREAGLQVNPQGQVLVDAALRSVSHPAVYAVGDIAAPVNPPGQPLPMGCKSALPTGAHAGENLARELQGRELLPFQYALMFYCVSLGRRAGLIQWADAAGRLTGRILTGARGALFKETICRMTWWSLVLESRGRRAVIWKTALERAQTKPLREETAQP
jgi:NADH dehydrogenase